MFKVMGLLSVLVVVLAGAWSAEAGLTLGVESSVNSMGDDVYVISLTSDAGAVSSLGIHVVGEGNLGQYHSFSLPSTPFPSEDYCPFEPWFCYDPSVDTHAMFLAQAEGLIVPTGAVDTADELLVQFTGFDPFTQRDIVQVVLLEGAATVTIDAVADGVEEQLIMDIPEPCALGVLGAGLFLLMRRR